MGGLGAAGAVEARFEEDIIAVQLCLPRGFHRRNLVKECRARYRVKKCHCLLAVRMERKNIEIEQNESHARTSRVDAFLPGCYIVIMEGHAASRFSTTKPLITSMKIVSLC